MPMSNVTTLRKPIEAEGLSEPLLPLWRRTQDAFLSAYGRDWIVSKRRPTDEAERAYRDAVEAFHRQEPVTTLGLLLKVITHGDDEMGAPDRDEYEKLITQVQSLLLDAEAARKVVLDQVADLIRESTDILPPATAKKLATRVLLLGKPL